MEDANEALEWLEKISKKIEMQPESNDREASRGLAGYVYILQSENGFYKIGKAKNVHARATSWKNKFPIKIDLIHSFACHNRTKVENFLHDKYSKKRSQREWYKLDEEDVRYITSLTDYKLG